MFLASAVLTVALAGGAAAQQEPPPATSASVQEPPAAGATPLLDAFDLIRKLRHKEQTEQERAAAADPSEPMYAFAPVIGYKPSSGAMFGVAGNVAVFRGDPTTTHISSAVASLTVSTLKQTSLTARFGLFTRDDRWKVDGDNRFQWTSQDTFGLGTGTAPADQVKGTIKQVDEKEIYSTVYALQNFTLTLFTLHFHFRAAARNQDLLHVPALSTSEFIDGHGCSFTCLRCGNTGDAYQMDAGMSIFTERCPEPAVRRTSSDGQTRTCSQGISPSSTVPMRWL